MLLANGRQEEFRTKLELAVELVVILLNPGILIRTIVFDSWYCSAWLLEFLQYHKLHFVNQLKEDRTVYWEGEWMQLKDLFTLIPSSGFEKTEYITQTKYSLR